MALYGLMAEFSGAADLLEAVHHTREVGYRKIDAFSPFAIAGMSEALNLQSISVSYFVLGGGLFGLLLGYGMQFFSAVINYPVNIGGRPLNSIPAFIPVTFEMAILVGAISGLIGMLVMNGLPMPYHPVFNVPEFKEMTRDRFFLCIEVTDPKFDLQETRRFLQSLNSLKVSDVEA
jgi:hypothetical protein